MVYDSTQLVSFTTITDWKVVPMAIVPSGKFLRLQTVSYDIVGLRHFGSDRLSQFSLFDDQLPG